jgi:hypothetical protein
MFPKPLLINILPKPPSFRKLLGPSFIILGLGLGSGEVILWPYLTSHYGLGIIWGAVIGITFQFFMNMEIERYALAHGESVFVGLTRKIRLISYWFLLSTFLPWVWPGIAASSAKIFAYVFGIGNSSYLAIIFLVVMGLILSLGPVLYKTVERFQKVLILIGVPSVFVLSVILAKSEHWIALAKGVVGIGSDYLFLPESIAISSFLAALAYAGAGGNLNLAQAFYIKDKGYGMGKYAGRITSLLTGSQEEVSITGSTFEVNPENVRTFKQWWKKINIEHFLVFWLTGSITILLLALLSYSTTYNIHPKASDLGFIFQESIEIGKGIFPFAGTFFLLIAGFTLFGTQLTVFDATSRILAENTLLASFDKLKEKHFPKIFYIVLWLQILAGILIFLFGFTQPLQLLIIAATLNAIAMFVHTGLTLWLNLTNLNKALRPSIFRITAMLLAFVFYGSFSIYTVLTSLLNFKF